MSHQAQQTNGTNGVNGHAHSALVSAQEFAQHDYDYVILGGGTAGLTVAARLTENADVTVGVIEAGSNRLNDMLVDTPAFFSQMFSKADYDWAFRTTPQKGNMPDKVQHVVRGKMLGGSSGINYMMYVRGSDADYDDWATIVDDPKWGSKETKKYMRKHQTLEPIDEKTYDQTSMLFVGENHGTTGPIKTGFSPWALDVEDDLIKALDEATGLTKKPVDPWSGDHIGFYHILSTIARTGPHKGKRSYAARDYLEPNLGRPNLFVTTESLVTRINLDGDRATGATYRSGGQDYSVKAKREVIVSGGVINSPQILELSGIGNPTVLQKAGVECKIENQGVGENLQDHIIGAVAYEAIPGVDTLDQLQLPENGQKAMGQYMTTQDGPMSCTLTVQGFFPYNLVATPEELEAVIKSIENIPDQRPFAKQARATIIAHLKNNRSANIQIVTAPTTANFRDAHGDQTKLFVPYTDPTLPGNISINACLQYPVSRGSVHITSSDPEVQPAIDPAYISEEADVDVLAIGVKLAYKALNSGPLKDKLGKRTWPNPEYDLTNTEDCKKSIRDSYLSEYHPCGTVAMGDALDNRLKVKGTKNIRVVDASIFPTHVSGNIVGTVYMVAERAADIIKEDWDHVPLRKMAAS